MSDDSCKLHDIGYIKGEQSLKYFKNGGMCEYIPGREGTIKYTLPVTDKSTVYTIYAEDENGNAVIETVRVTVKEIKLDKTKAAIKKGKVISLTASFTDDSIDQEIKFKTSNKKVCKITSDGKIKGIKKGKAVITAYSSGSKYATCKITVK